MITYKLKGLDGFLRNVRKKPREAQRAVDKVLARSSLRVERGAKFYAPWDTGWMSNTIYSAPSGLLSHKVVSPAHYSVYVELGTRKMAAQPFMMPALESEYPKLMGELKVMFKG